MSLRPWCARAPRRPGRPGAWLLPLCLTVFATKGAGLDAVVTEANLRKVVLGEPGSFTEAQLKAMDLNTDGKVDVADLLKLKQGDPNPSIAVTFQSSTTSASEDSNEITIPVTVNPGYTGPVCYVFSGTATVGADFTSAAPACTNNVNARQLTFSASDPTASIRLTIVDDTDIPANELTRSPTTKDEGLESLTITLIPAPGYQLTVAQQHTVYIEDNDAFWQGVWEVGNLVMNFRMELAKDGNLTSGKLIGSKSPAFGAPTGDPVTGDPAVVITSTDTTLTMELGPFTVPANRTLLGVELQRSFVLTADEIDFTGGLIAGTVTETVEAKNNTQFNREAQQGESGRFRLVRGPATSSLPSSTLTQVPP